MIASARRQALAAAGLVLLLVASGVAAQDNPTAGKNLFDNTPTASGNATLMACPACHFNVQNRRDAIDPGGDLDFDLVLARFLSAITAQPVMNQFNTGLTAQQKRDIAAYIADVPKSRPNLVAFSVNAANVESTPVTITFSNAVTATAPLTLGAIGIGGGNPTDFLIKSVGTTCASSAMLAAGASCTVTVAFRPATAANKAALLTISYSQSGSSITRNAQLTGTVSTAPPPTSASGGGGAVALMMLAPLLLGAAARRRDPSHGD